MLSLSCNRERFEELTKNPLFFLKKIDRSYSNYKGEWVEDIHWEPMDKDFNGSIDYKLLGDGYLDYVLIVVGQEIVKEKKDNSVDDEKSPVEFEIHEANHSIQTDWLFVINSCIIRSGNSEDKFPYIHFLWFLDKTRWSYDELSQAIKRYDIKSQPFIFNVITKIGRCLSPYKQQLLQRCLSQFNHNYAVYIPEIIPDALNYVNPKPNQNGLFYNLFQSTDYIVCPRIDSGVTYKIPQQTGNPLIKLLIWLNNSNASITYSLLGSLFSIVPGETQMNIVKRYFHDIRLGKTDFDSSLVEQFKDNTYAEFIRYRYCVETPEEPINLAVPFLCDCVLTIHKTQGRSLQSFDGILDFAMSHCDVTNPSIRLGMESFIPRCQGGAIYNSSFLGFVDYAITFKLDESKFTADNLQQTILSFLNRRKKHTYYACGFDQRPLTEDQMQHCLKEFKDKSKLSCYTRLPYKDKWVVMKSDAEWLNTFLKDPITPKSKYENDSELIIDINQTSTEVFEKYIRGLASKMESVDDGVFLIWSYNMRSYSLLTEYSQPVNMRIYPQPQAVIGHEFDVFGLSNSIHSEENNTNNNSDEYIERFNALESTEVYKRVVESLKTELGEESLRGNYFELPYDRMKLRNILGLYYFKGHYPDNAKGSIISFLTKQGTKTFTPFCAPRLADAHNKATDLPFFWCRGTECFHNSLSTQVVEKCHSWRDYSLYHMIEIIGFPKLYLTEGGYEPDSIITEFIAVANRVLKKFKRLKCRSCGHLMYTDHSSGYNRYNYYSCINPTCNEYNKAVYLSYCYKCKKGLIDSRDSVQCPNGWYICPTCHSCCDDAQYERQAQRYIVSKRPVPERVQNMLGKGHNDKGIYFCHVCGTELQQVPERGNGVLGCPTCHVIYDDNANEQENH